METDILKKIVQCKKEEIAAAKRHFPENRLREQAAGSQKKRPFLKKLRQPGLSGVNIIAEIKRASPSKGLIRPDLDAARYAVEYEKGGAAALSVLTDQKYFRGSAEDLRKAREAASIPVLRKDFLISSYQLYESSVWGADAVLLIVKILSRNQLCDYLNLCHELEMDALVEIHSKKELEDATRAGARLIGINNRNLSSFETDIETAIQMASFLEAHQVAVAESGIRDRNDIERTKNSGIWNFLIGESLVRAENPATFLRSLRGNP
jgi:indole-3-glycerol phosphate synthase